jgi:F0F1-type ATP synthase assembly protein I
MTQLIVMSIYLALVYLLSWGDWFSGVTGCLASLLPTIYYSIRMMRQVDSYSAEQWLAYAYRSNVVKWMMMAMIFALAFTSSYQWDPVILFSGYLLMQVSGMFLPLIQKGN